MRRETESRSGQALLVQSGGALIHDGVGAYTTADGTGARRVDGI